MPIAQALERLERGSWHALTVRYARGEVDAGSPSLCRVHADGREEWLGSFAGR